MERIKKTMDGNHAAAYVAYAYTEVAPVYPITPSTVMAEVTEEWAAAGEQNALGGVPAVVEMQSEAGAAGAMHGALLAGALATTFTASQGLLLMIPELYKMAGEHLPGVVHVAARTIATHALSIFGDHSDIYACRQTGIAIFCENSVQEVMDLAPVAHLCALEGRIPFLNFFDGFRTSHEIQKIACWSQKELQELFPVEEVMAFRRCALNSNHPVEMGAAQNPDIFFQVKEASNLDYERLPVLVKGCLAKINEKCGTHYRLYEYVGSRDATTIIIAMGSVCETIEETISFLQEKGEKVGCLKVRLYRPFSKADFLDAIPDTVERIQVLDRTKEPGTIGEPLYEDVVTALQESAYRDVEIFSGRYGLSSKETTPEQIVSVFHNRVKRRFTIGIRDDVTNLSLEEEKLDFAPIEGQMNCKFWGIGSDGTVGANKNTIQIIGDYTKLHVQAYFEYDSKKSGGVTISHLRFGTSEIKSEYGVKRAQFVACHCPAYLGRYELVQDLEEGGTFLLNCSWKKEELAERLPEDVKQYLVEKKIRFYIIDAAKIAKELGLAHRTNTILQAAFFTLTDILPKETALEAMRQAVQKSYLKKGEEVIAKNLLAVERGFMAAEEVEIPADWKKKQVVIQECGADTERHKNQELIVKSACRTEENEKLKQDIISYEEHIQSQIVRRKGDELPVSVFLPYRNGMTPSGTAALEKRGVASEVPVWDVMRCIQCNQCSYVCPHAVIRPVVMEKEEVIAAPDGMPSKEMNGFPRYHYAIVISTLDCTGCANCVEVCPAPGKALFLKQAEKAGEQQKFFDYGKKIPKKEEVFQKFRATTVKGSQFRQPLLEFSGACGGCGETPYAKLVTQLFGSRLLIANATGCSSIWGNSSPSTPYTFNQDGRGPAWANSLFEDAAEFGYGMFFAQKQIRERLRKQLEQMWKKTESLEIKNWLETFPNGSENEKATDELIAWLEKRSLDEIGSMGKLSTEIKNILNQKDYLSKKSQWIFGGDGWAYDIGFGGLDHVLASGEDMNVLVFDTEIYSNTGGQASKATPKGAFARLASNGKTQNKKKLGQMMMTYQNVYVAQICMGADQNQCIKALVEAEQYQGPSLVIAYAPCISHGIRRGMRYVQEEEKKAVCSGYWDIFRYHPAVEGKEAAFYEDGKKKTESLEKFYQGENRF